MKRKMMMLLVGMFLLPTLSGCIVAPLDDGYYRDRYDNDRYGHHGGHHHDHHGRRGGWYEGRR